MIDENKGASGSPNADISDDATEMTGKQSVSYETYSKTIGEVKSLKKKLSEFAAKEAEREQSSLLEQGKWKEAAESAAKKAKEFEAKLSEKDKAFAKKVFNQELRSVAAELGVIPEVLDDLPKLGDWSNVEIDDEFNINSTTLKDAVSNLLKSKPFLAKRTASSPKDVNTSASGAQNGGKIDPAKMTKEQLMNAIRAAK
jgi:hypothetical protein